jgi:Peptidase MA superfamily
VTRRVVRAGILAPILVVSFLVVSQAAAPRAAAAGLAKWGTPVITTTFEYVDFEQPVTLSFQPDHAELLVELPGRLPLLTEVDPPESTGTSVLRYRAFPDSLGISPHTPVTGRWRLTFGAAIEETGPEASVTFEDDRFSWQEASRTAHGVPITVHWYEGGADLADRALDASMSGVQRAEDALGVSQQTPVDVFLYPEPTPFQEATGATRDFAGIADLFTGTTFVLVESGSIDEQESASIRHEVTHIVFNAAYGIPATSPPRWLNEGAASYLMDLYDGTWFREPASRAARTGSVIPLKRLGFAFPTESDGIDLAYEESASAVEYLIQAHGLHALADLAAAYRSGKTDDEAFTSSIGLDVEGFQAAWLGHLQGTELKSYGPLPAPPGPEAEGSTRRVAQEPGGAWNGASGLALRLLFVTLAALIVEVEVLRIRANRWRARAPVGWTSWAREGEPAVLPAMPPPPPTSGGPRFPPPPPSRPARP